MGAGDPPGPVVGVSAFTAVACAQASEEQCSVTPKKERGWEYQDLGGQGKEGC